MTIFLALCMVAQAAAGNYSAERIDLAGVEAVRLADIAAKTEVTIIPSMGNNAYEIKINGQNILWAPYSLAELRKRPTHFGNPFLSPWANRIDGDVYWANGRSYRLNPALKNFEYDANHKPIHGLLVHAADWQVVSMGGDAESAWVTSKLEFWRRPDRMAQFPFAHNVIMTHRLRQGRVEVETMIENLSEEPMPLSLGYHTYYRLTDSPRDDWRAHIAARDHVELNDLIMPTGKTTAVENPEPGTLRDYAFNDVYTGLIRDEQGKSEFWVRGKEQKIRFLFGPKYDVAIVWSPPGTDFICFEPMVGLTNVFNLAHQGLYPNLQSVPPHAVWRESFWIVPEGF